MDRIAKFKALENHPMLKKQYTKLTKKDHSFCIDFLTSNKLDKNEMAFKINRLFIDEEKPKNWLVMQELLICSL